jgi:hypothetical protein
MRKRYHLVSLDITLTEIVTHHAPSLPLPASGKTGVRFAALSSWSAQDLSLGRLAEGHVDALAILAEGSSEWRGVVVPLRAKTILFGERPHRPGIGHR